MSGVNKLGYQYSRAQLDTLTRGVGTDDDNLGGAYTSFKIDQITGNLMVHSAETAAMRNSQFTKEGVIHIVQKCTSAVAAAARQYIGKPNITTTRQALQNACSAALQTFADLGALAGDEGTGYSVDVYVSGNDTSVGKCTVAMTLRTAVELRVISLVVNVQE
jgi:hypothetical protein